MRLYFLRQALSPFLFTVLLAFSPSILHAQTAASERISIINGLAPTSNGEILIATQYGLLKAKQTGMATMIAGLEMGLMTLATDPQNPKIMLTSGFAPGGKAVGVMKSSDGGESWNHISDGANGPAAFEYLDISGADAKIVYGVFKDKLQISRDGGTTWKIISDLPDNLFGFTASSKAVDTLYAATKEGLMVSRDGGGKWGQAYTLKRPATMIHAAAGGRLYAFIPGTGLVTTKEPSLAWKTLSKDFQDHYFLNLVVDLSDAEHLYATADTGAIMTSKDGGKTWISFEGSDKATAENIAKGKALFEETCQECHGVKGIGENPKDPNAKDEFGFLAPSLNDDGHAWHHSDSNITESILKGSDRNERMIAFKEVLSSEQVENVISYVKSLWSFRSLACQGVRHMSCMGQ